MPDAADKKVDRLRELFRTYDKSGDGFLDISELETILKTLGTFNNHEIGSICVELDKTGDSKISYKEFVAWIRSRGSSREAAKAKAILAPSDDDGLKVVFYNFCGAGHVDMDGKAFLKMCRDCNFIDKNLTETSVDLIFSNTKVKPKGQRSISYEQFEVALELVAAKKGVSSQQVRDAVLESTRPILQGTKADNVRFYDDPKGIDRSVESHGPTHSSPKRGPASRKGKPSMTWTRVLARDLESPAADNKNLWRTFGIDKEAGRALKRLYSGPYRPEGSRDLSSPRRRCWPPEQDTYVAVNSLGAVTEGLHFRQSMNLQDLCRSPHEYVPWGHPVQGERVDACWLRVGDRFLPVEVNTTRLLKRWDGPGPHPKAASPGLLRAASLPAIRSQAKPAMGTRVLIGIPWGR